MDVNMRDLSFSSGGMSGAQSHTPYIYGTVTTTQVEEPDTVNSTNVILNKPLSTRSTAFPLYVEWYLCVNASE